MTFAELVEAIEHLRIERGSQESAEVSVSHWSHQSGNKTLEWRIFWTRVPSGAGMSYEGRGPTAARALVSLLEKIAPVPPDVGQVDPVKEGYR
jgi:hypothetical protein